jgi:hypothetical protein
MHVIFDASAVFNAEFILIDTVRKISIFMAHDGVLRPACWCGFAAIPEGRFS